MSAVGKRSRSQLSKQSELRAVRIEAVLRQHLPEDDYARERFFGQVMSLDELIEMVMCECLGEAHRF
jgi:hypothetical protein